MKKSEIIEKIATEAGISKQAAAKALEVAIDSIKGAVSKGDSVNFVGFGTFKATARAARAGRNPKTGETIKIKAASTPKFSASPSFKASVSSVKAMKSPVPTGGGGPGKKR